MASWRVVWVVNGCAIQYAHCYCSTLTPDAYKGTRGREVVNVQTDKICHVDGCECASHAGGLCRSHYNRQYKRQRKGLPSEVTLRFLRAHSGRKECSVDGCERVSHAGGLCSMHYKRQRRSIPLDAPIRQGQVGLCRWWRMSDLVSGPIHSCKCGGNLATPCVTRTGEELRLPHTGLLFAVRYYLIYAQDGLCGFCWDDLEDDYSFDHIIPVSSGGRGMMANLRLVHLYCNTARNNSQRLVDVGHPRGPWCEYPRAIGPYARIMPTWTGLPHGPLHRASYAARSADGRFV